MLLVYKIPQTIGYKVLSILDIIKITIKNL